VPKDAAAAVSWRKFGDRSLSFSGDATLPLGAVVVLSPADDSGPTGHVGFYVGRDGKNVQLLGGNQSNTCKVSNYAWSRIVEVRWLTSAAPAQHASVPGTVTGVAAGGVAAFKTGEIPNGSTGKQMADLIVRLFAEAGFSPVHQIAALANAIGESGLNPGAHNTSGEDSVGLFQCNRDGGLGSGFTVDQLKNPEFNTKIIINKAKTVTSFKNASTIEAAVDAFVRKIEIPANAGAAVAKRLATALALMP
jgi:hypothetical protein